jgi:hypothetical protein
MANLFSAAEALNPSRAGRSDYQRHRACLEKRLPLVRLSARVWSSNQCSGVRSCDSHIGRLAASLDYRRSDARIVENGFAASSDRRKHLGNHCERNVANH